MNTKRFPTAFFIVYFLIGTFISCGIDTTRISDILAHPRDYADKEVTISGEVTETFSLFVVKYFVVRDSSGEISVVRETSAREGRQNQGQRDRERDFLFRHKDSPRPRGSSRKKQMS